MKFVVGKKYILKSGVLYECTAVTTTGLPVMKHGSREFLCQSEYLHRYKEYIEKKKGTFWLNIYPDHCSKSDFHSSRERADQFAGSSRLACIEVNWEEGQGL